MSVYCGISTKLLLGLIFTLILTETLWPSSSPARAGSEGRGGNGKPGAVGWWRLRTWIFTNTVTGNERRISLRTPKAVSENLVNSFSSALAV